MIRFDVVGIPAPQGSKRHVGGGRMVESSKRVQPWREAVAWAALSAAAPARPLTGPVAVEIVFRLPRPKSAPKSRLWPFQRPDIDKLLRATFDGITTSGLWLDDAQAVDVLMKKRYARPGEPLGASIRLSVPARGGVVTDVRAALTVADTLGISE